MAGHDPDRRPFPGSEGDDLEHLVDRELVAMTRRVRRLADEELAEIEYETDRAEVKRQDLTIRSMQALMEGERWQVRAGSRVMEGLVVHAGQDFVSLRDRLDNRLDVHHRAIDLVRVATTDPDQGRAPTTLRPATLVAHLLGLEQLRPVELGGVNGDWSLVGVIESVNQDHLIMIEPSGETAIVPLASIGLVVRSADHGRRSDRHR